MQTTTTLKFKDSKSGNSARGGWKLSIYEGSDGKEYSTLDGNLASKIQENDGSLLVVGYSERPAKDPKYPPNNSIESVEVAPEGAKASPVVTPAAGGRGEFRSPEQIIRSVALEQAVSSFHAAQLDPIADLPGVLQQAVVFEKYISEGLEDEPEA